MFIREVEILGVETEKKDGILFDRRTDIKMETLALLLEKRAERKWEIRIVERRRKRVRRCSFPEKFLDFRRLVAPFGSSLIAERFIKLLIPLSTLSTDNNAYGEISPERKNKDAFLA